MPDKFGGLDAFINKLKGEAEKTKQKDEFKKMATASQKPTKLTPEEIKAGDDQETAIAKTFFEQLLKGKAHLLPNDNYASTLPHVDKIALATPKGVEDNQQVHVTLYYKEDVITRDKEGNTIKDSDGKPKINKDVPRHYTVTIGKDGTVIGGGRSLLEKKLPPKLHYLNQAKILTEVTDIVRVLKLDQWTPLDIDVDVEQPVEIKGSGKQRAKEEKEPSEQIVDTSFIDIIFDNPMTLRGLYFKNADKISTNTLRNYSFFVYPGGLLCQSEYYGHRLYAYKFSQPLDENESRMIREAKIEPNDMVKLLADKGFLDLVSKRKATIRKEMAGQAFWYNHPAPDAPLVEKKAFMAKVFDRMDNEGFYEKAA